MQAEQLLLEREKPLSPACASTVASIFGHQTVATMLKAIEDIRKPTPFSMIHTLAKILCEHAIQEGIMSPELQKRVESTARRAGTKWGYSKYVNRPD